MAEGWDPRPESVETVLAACTPIAESIATLVDERFRIRVRGYTEVIDLPDEFVGSVRVLVRVGDRVVVCINQDGFRHAWPGGRREPGETHAETACREVHEETGWQVDPASLVLVGWLHFEHLLDRPEGHDYRHADFFNLLFVGEARTRDGGAEVDWTDTEGYEVSSELMTIDDAIACMNALDADVSRAFLRMLGGAC